MTAHFLDSVVLLENLIFQHLWRLKHKHTCTFCLHIWVIMLDEVTHLCCFIDLRVKENTVIWGGCSSFHVVRGIFFLMNLFYWVFLEIRNTLCTCYHLRSSVCEHCKTETSTVCDFVIQTTDSNRKKNPCFHFNIYVVYVFFHTSKVICYEPLPKTFTFFVKMQLCCKSDVLQWLPRRSVWVCVWKKCYPVVPKNIKPLYRSHANIEGIYATGCVCL